MKTLALLIALALAGSLRAEDVMRKVCPAYMEPITVASAKAVNQPTASKQPAAIRSESPVKSRSSVRGSINVSVSFTLKRW